MKKVIFSFFFLFSFSFSLLLAQTTIVSTEQDENGIKLLVSGKAFKDIPVCNRQNNTCY